MAAQYQSEFEFSLELVKECGKIIKDAFLREKKVTEKSNANDLVTETDQEVEKKLIGGLKAQYPDHRFIGEESVAGGLKCELTDLPTWVIDPIDGTTNFVHSNPHICTILAFMVNKQVEICVIHNPVLDQTWTALRGHGAKYNGREISVSSCRDLEQSMMCSEMAAWGDSDRNAVARQNINTLLDKVRSIRAYGSAGINLAYLAMGSIDCYFEFGFHIWDYAGAVLLVREAGGVAMDTEGGEVDFLARRVLCASSQELANQYLAQIKSIRLPKD